MHLSNYCGIANTILKAHTATESGSGDPMAMATLEGICSKTVQEHMSDCVSLKRFPEGTAARLSPGFGPGQGQPSHIQYNIEYTPTGTAERAARPLVSCRAFEIL